MISLSMYRALYTYIIFYTVSILNEKPLFNLPWSESPIHQWSIGVMVWMMLAMPCKNSAFLRKCSGHNGIFFIPIAEIIFFLVLTYM